MKEVLSEIDLWRSQGKRVAIARVVGVEGSGPRDVGATMAVSDAGEVAGSVSGGCVEGAVVTEALKAMGVSSMPGVDSSVATGDLGDVDRGRVGCPLVQTFGYSDDEAFAVGLTCGGTLHILIDPELPDFYDELKANLKNELSFVWVTVSSLNPADAGEYDVNELSAEGRNAFSLSGDLPEIGASMLVYPDGSHTGSLGRADLDQVVIRDSIGALAVGRTDLRHYGRNGQARHQEVGIVFEVFAPPPKMIIFGAVDFTAALARVAKILGYRVTVCDARPVFATQARFPMADEVVVDWPDRFLTKVLDALNERDAICVLTHDPKFDIPAIQKALESKVGYIGAMGSRRTNEERTARLLAAGVPLEILEERVMAPIGLDIAARTPEETAISICAEIISKRTGRSAKSLSDTLGSIHDGN
ncbi:MAG: XdhC/CoxI family protein [Actinomycetota bacterium]|nr:MAG: XdhC/CoxI family protein [Actinomycetota bacterium]